MSRFTRGGPEHGMKLEYDLRAAGVQVVFVSDNLPDGDHAGIVKSVGFFAAQQHAKAISFATSRGLMSALEQGKLAHCLRPPYGIDKMYIAADGKPSCVIRLLPDGTQQKLDPASGELIGTFGRNEGGRCNHYRVVRHIYRRHFFDGWGSWRIAHELNTRAAPAPSGKMWTTDVVLLILHNPVYTGVGIANRYSDAVYYMSWP
jgi:hypothetical protein